MILCGDWWPWTKPAYITMTRRQSNNQWSVGMAGHPAPKNSEDKNPLENSRLDFLGSRRDHPHWLSSKGPNYQCGVLLISAGAIEGHFEWKTSRQVHLGGLVLARQYSGSPGTCNPEETGLPGLPMFSSSTLFSGSDPVGLPPVPWIEKTIKVRHLSPDADVIAATETWLNGKQSDFFLSYLQKLEKRGKMCIELRGEHIEKYPSLVSVPSFLPVWSRNLSAPLLSQFCPVLSRTRIACNNIFLMILPHIRFYKNLNVFTSPIYEKIEFYGNAFSWSDCSFLMQNGLMSQGCTLKLTTFLYILNYKCIIYTYAQVPFY